MTKKTVMVYRVDGKTMSKEPLGILVERRKEERGDNLAGMVRLARKEFVGTGDGHDRITVGDYVTPDHQAEYTGDFFPHPDSDFNPRKDN